MIRFYITCFIVLSLGVVACKKDNAPANDNYANNRLSFVLNDNFNLSLFSAALNYTHWYDTLLQRWPYTALAPDDAAFRAAGYSSAVQVRSTDYNLMQHLVRYHILGGVYRLNELPYAFNQQISTLDGNKMYVTHWVKDTDTVLTINGARIIAYNKPASNGIIQVLNTVLSPAIYNNVHDAIAADTALTFFNAAINKAGLSYLLEGNNDYTVFAPVNNAFRTIGYRSVDSVNNTNVSALASLLRYHILTGRRFVYDYILITDATAQSQQTMLDGNTITVSLVPNPQQPGTYNTITIKGTGNNLSAAIVRSNILAGNGVVHTVDQVLKTNF